MVRSDNVRCSSCDGLVRWHQGIDLLPVALRRGIFVAEVYSLTHGCWLYHHNQGHRMVEGEGLHLGQGLGEPFEGPNSILLCTHSELHRSSVS